MLKVGQKVRLKGQFNVYGTTRIYNATGVVVERPYWSDVGGRMWVGVEWKGFNGGHNCGGKCKNRRGGWRVPLSKVECIGWYNPK